MGLSNVWRTRADELERFAPAAAEAFRQAAEELDESLRADEDELLPPAQAAKESLSERRLRELVAEGKLANHGKKGAPKYRRGDLPRRTRTHAAGWDADAHVAGIVGA